MQYHGQLSPCLSCWGNCPSSGFAHNHPSTVRPSAGRIPKLAAATFLYEFYYDVIKGGMYIWEIERMHEKYGTSKPADQMKKNLRYQSQMI
jgi:hypothetical protein